ncbi:transcriptional regulator [Virgisporangium aliadipatigenens]|uniref:Transcriptional regulator n=1 Tax=Virgisporangium aliadipatigenens TaxID=741659 RepID=A0A8J4DSN9_9ACTN|nr:Scr1 family TA system antitoxin-like transcriptional regulator [Virgisporangium aliadipatigenens]GIJ48909.1 transcriptional regulator [Virgisporangium aliadipatigenens]
MADAPLNDADDDEDSVPFGRTIRGLRRAKSMTGQQLAVRVGLSQAQISRIETGAVVPAADEVRAIAEALDLSDGETERLLERARATASWAHEMQVHSGELSAEQDLMANLERNTRISRAFTPGTLFGLLQTAEYARAVFTGLQRAGFRVGDERMPVARAVAARIRRQEALGDHGKKFVFVMPESVLQVRVCAPVHMLSQLEHLRVLARESNVTIGIIPEEVQIAVVPVDTFNLLDDKIVLIDHLTTFVTSRSQVHLATYSRVFKALEAQAVTEIDEILEKHKARYIAML